MGDSMVRGTETSFCGHPDAVLPPWCQGQGRLPSGPWQEIYKDDAWIGEHGL